MRNRGFTLMEMMIVVAIMMILSGVGLANFSFTRQKARDTQRKNDLSQIGRALETYVNDFARYPLSDADGSILGCEDDAVTACVWGDDFTATYNQTTQVYMTKLPNDPSSGQNYYYQSDGVSYSLYSTMENDNDPYCRDDLEISDPDLECGELACGYKYTNVGGEAGVDSGRCDVDP